MSAEIVQSLIDKTEDEYLHCKNRIFEELIKFVALDEDIKKFKRLIIQYQDNIYKNLEFIHTAEYIIGALHTEQHLLRQSIDYLKIRMKELKKIIKEEKKLFLE